MEVLIGRVPATASIADRAAALEELISSKYAGRDINLIGHSMVGLMLYVFFDLPADTLLRVDWIADTWYRP